MLSRQSLRIAAIQMNSQSDLAFNLSEAERLMEEAIRDEKPDLLVLPEHFQWSGGTAAEKRASACSFPNGEPYARMKAFAARHQVWVHAGSIYEEIPGNKDQCYNTTVVFNRAGVEVARYRKIHLFDIVAADGSVYRESASICAGDRAVSYDLEGIQVGCAICYDLRFPALFQELSRGGADVIILPAAFTMLTGKDHWEVLLRARAIENAAYVVASAQCGSFSDGAGGRRMTYGQSLIADPWGHVVARAAEEVGYISHVIKKSVIDQVRSRIPVIEHRASFAALP